MKLSLALFSLAFTMASLGGQAAAVTGAIDDGGPEPGHAARDPGPAVESEPKPKPVLGDAEPAPVGAPAPVPQSKIDEQDRGARHRVALLPRFAHRLGDAGRAVTPANGFGLAGTYEFRYAQFGRGLELAFGIDFAFDRFATGERAPCSDQFSGRSECVANLARTGMPGTFAATREISETSFVLVHTIAAHAGRLRPYLTLGTGVGVGFFDSVQPDLQPGSAKDVHVLGRGTLGLDVPLARAWSVTIRADYTVVRAVSPFTTSMGRTLPLFGDLFDVGVGVAHGF